MFKAALRGAKGLPLLSDSPDLFVRFMARDAKEALYSKEEGVRKLALESLYEWERRKRWRKYERDKQAS